MNRKDLKHDDYHWETVNNEQLTMNNEGIGLQEGIAEGARPGPGPFDHRAGEEVLFLINCFITRYGLERPEAIIKIEVMLHDYLPGEIRCRREAFTWLRDHWSDYDRTVNNEQLTMNNEVVGVQEAVNNEQLTMNNEVVGVQGTVNNDQSAMNNLRLGDRPHQARCRGNGCGDQVGGEAVGQTARTIGRIPRCS